jgi:hypothetical protein
MKQRDSRLGDERIAGIGQFNPLVIPLEYSRIQVPLEILDLLGQSRLRNMQSSCGPRKIQLFRDRNSCLMCDASEMFKHNQRYKSK